MIIDDQMIRRRILNHNKQEPGQRHQTQMFLMRSLKRGNCRMNTNNLQFRQIKPDEVSLLKEYWLHFFSQPDPLAIDYYFQYEFRCDKTYVLILDGELIGSATLEPYEMELHGKVLQTSLIVGVFVVEKFQGQGYMTFMMNYLTKFLESREMVTCIQEEVEGLYNRYGFEDVFPQNVWEIKRYMIPPMSSEGIRYVLDPVDCLELYEYFTRYFTGYFKRDVRYYENLRQEVHVTKKQMISFYEHQQLMATGLVIFDQEIGYVTELLYRDSKSLLTVLNYFLSMVPTLKVHTSKIEDLSKIIEEATAESSNWMKVRLNDKDAFNRLYKVDIKRAQSAMTAFGKPVFNSQSS